jgi:polysaccharide export outer membrane protein
MKLSNLIKTVLLVAILVCGSWAVSAGLNFADDNIPNSKQIADLNSSQVLPPQISSESETVSDGKIQLCQGYEDVAVPGGFGYGPVRTQVHQPSRMMTGVDQCDRSEIGREARWRNGECLPWESMAYGEYIGPHRTPHVAEYKLRVNDLLECIYFLTREKTVEPYQLYVGDAIQIDSAIDASLNQTNVTLLPDGTVSLNLIGQVQAAGKTVDEMQRELNEKYKRYVKNPSVVVSVIRSETPLQDLIAAVDARAGTGGQGRQARVSPDGTIQLPLIGNVPAIGLTLNEIAREINARYRQHLRGIEVTPILLERAPRFIFVVGEVAIPGRYELTGPTSAMQSIALARGFRRGGNLRQLIVFRRDQNWRLTATKLDLSAALLGKAPHPSDEIWLRDSDIVLIPAKPIQRLSEAVDLYLTQTLYGIFPQVGNGFRFDNFTNL